MKILLSFLLVVASAFGVPALSTNEIARGEVVGLCVVRGETVNIKPDSLIIYKAKIKLDSPLRRAEEEVVVYSKRPIPQWLFGKRVRAVVIYGGDERGGRYWLVRINEE